MVPVKTKSAIYVFVIISGLALFASSMIRGIELSRPNGLIALLPSVVMVDAVAFIIFSKWVWHLRLLRGWLVLIPDLRGTWAGTIQSTWINPDTGCPVGPIPAIVTIRQSLISVSVVVTTGEMTSRSYVAGYRIDQDQQLCKLCYSYTSQPDPSVSDRSTAHDGTQALDILEGTPLRMRGDYWTQRKTTGKVELERTSAKVRRVVSPDSLDHPLSGQAANQVLDN